MTTKSPHIRPVLLTASLLGLLAALVITFPQTVSATTLMKDNFEVTTLSSEWDGLVIHGDANPAGSAKVTNAQAYTGSSSIQFNWIASNTGTIYLYKTLPNVRHFFLRYAVKWSPGFQFFPGTTSGKKVGRTWGSGSDDDIDFVVSKKGGGQTYPIFTVYVNQFNRNNIHPSLLPENIGAETPVNTNQWYCFDWHIVAGMGTGSIEGWIDGVKKWEFFNTYTSSIPLIKVDIGGNLAPDRPTQNQTEWYDNVAVANGPIGTAEVAGCTTSLEIPLRPTGLTVF
jgi:hypothetical protein